jgi:hypothetical protein
MKFYDDTKIISQKRGQNIRPNPYTEKEREGLRKMWENRFENALFEEIKKGLQTDKGECNENRHKKDC